MQNLFKCMHFSLLTVSEMNEKQDPRTLDDLMDVWIEPHLREVGESLDEYRNRASWEIDREKTTKPQYAENMIRKAGIEFEGFEGELSKEQITPYLLMMYERSEKEKDPIIKEQLLIGAAKLISLVETNGRYDPKKDPYNPSNRKPQE